MVRVFDNPIALQGKGADKVSIHQLRKAAYQWVDAFSEFEVKVEVTPGQHKETGMPVLIIEAIKPDEEIQ